MPDSEYAAKSYVGPYSIPLRAHIAADVENLLLAGRCFSATHAALGIARVMATTAVTGQAIGTAAAIALEKSLELARMQEPVCVSELQRRILRDGVFLPNHRNTDPLDLARIAQVTASSQALSEGVGPNDPWQSGGLLQDPRGGGFALTKTVAQWIAVEGGL